MLTKKIILKKAIIVSIFVFYNNKKLTNKKNKVKLHLRGGKMIDYRKGRTRYKINNLGSLYIEENKKKDIPTIFVGGQMEHRRHILEQTGFSPEVGYAMYDYDYPITTKDKSIYNAINFSNNLLELLQEAGIKKVNLITESYGSTIGAYASKSERINKVVAVHPPILGTPLAWENLMELNLTKRQKIFAYLANVLVNSEYGFQKDNAKQTDLRRVDLNKLIVVGSNLFRETEKSILKETYDIIFTISGMENDGVVIYNEEKFNKLGINYIREEKPTNHEDASHKEAIEKAYKLTLKK